MQRHTLNGAAALALAILVSGLGVHCGPGGASPPRQIPAADFFRSPVEVDYQLAPDGRHYAYVGRHADCDNLFIREIDTGVERRLTDAADRDINRFCWGNSETLLYLQDTAGDEEYRLYAIDIAAGTTRCLAGSPGVRVAILDLLPARPGEILVTMNRRDPQASDPYALDLASGALRLLAENPGDVRAWMADNQGRIRIALADDLLYREGGEGPFTAAVPLSGEDTFDPCYFTPDDGRVYAYSNLGRDKIAIVEYDLRAGREIRVLLEDPDYDVFGDDECDHFRYSAARGELLYALHTRERRELHFFDDELARLYGELREKLDGYELEFASASRDFGRIILEAYNDRMPGAYYLYDRATGELSLLARVAPWLAEEDLAAMQPVAYEARDGLTIHGYLTLPPGWAPRDLPLIVNPHAGPQWRNAWGYDAKTQFLANRGFAVLHVNFRGSEGYGKAFLRAGFKQWGLKMQDDISDGVLWLIEQGIADPRRVAILGWSYGGYAALAGVTFTPELYACGVDLWGITDYFSFYEGMPSYWAPFRDQIHQRWGDPVADRRQLFATSPIYHVDRIEAPVFIAQGVNDSRVRVEQSEQLVVEMERHNKDYEYFRIEGEGHAFSNEARTIELMERIAGFLARHIGDS
jgi:dipeptidyl aminopeptidase/acylaminoacyl peptidase